MIKVLTAIAILIAIQDAPQDNREYKGWSGCKVGSWTSLTMDMTAEGQAMKVEVTKTLKSLDEKEAVLTIKFAMSVGGRKMEQPAQEHKVPAKGGEFKPVKDAKEGDEELEIGGKKIKCHWMECAVDMENYKGTAKAWFSDEIPGAMAKFETTSTDAKAQKVKAIVTGWEKK